MARPWKKPRAQHRVVPPQADEAAHELGQLGVRLVPVDPGHLVLAGNTRCCPALRAADFVACANHGDPLRKQKRRQEISFLAFPKFQDFPIVRRALHSAVPRVIVIRAVAIVFPVGLVMFLVVRDQVLQGETVVGGDEVDAGGGVTAIALV